MNIKKLMSTALLLLVGAGAAVAGESTDVDAPSVKASPESEALTFQSGAWTGLDVGMELCGSMNRETGGIQIIEQYQHAAAMAASGDLPLTQRVGLRNLSKITKSNVGMPKFTGGIHFGYDCKFRDRPVTLGVLLGGGFGAGKCKISYPYWSSTAGDIVNDSQVSACRNNLTHGGFFDAATRFGYVIGRVLPFVKVGWGVHHYKFKHDSFPGLNFKTKSNWFNAFMFGVGVDVTVHKNILIGLASDVDLCAKKKFKVGTLLDPAGVLSVRPRNFRTMFTMKCKFAACK